jgi:RNA polymerase sigma-70 factor, ECF subfamily
MTEPTPLEGTVSVGEPSFQWFFESEYVRLCNALYLLTGDAYVAEDLAQEAMTRALERWERVGTMDSPVGYVYRTAMNLNRNRIRHLVVAARRAFSAEEALGNTDVVDDQQDVRRALTNVSPREREALVLVDWLEMNAEEAGQMLGIPPGTVRVRLHRGRTKLREQLGGSHG